MRLRLFSSRIAAARLRIRYKNCNPKYSSTKTSSDIAKYSSWMTLDMISCVVADGNSCRSDQSESSMGTISPTESPLLPVKVTLSFSSRLAMAASMASC